MRKLISFLAVTLLGTLGTYLLRGTFEAWFFDAVLHKEVEPHLGLVVEFGPTALLGAINLVVLLKIRSESQKEPPKDLRPKRMSVLNFYKKAGEMGIDFVAGNLRLASEVQKVVRQAAIDGALVAWGRQKIHGPLVEITKEQWKTQKIEWESCFKYGQPHSQIIGFAEDDSIASTHGVSTENDFHQRGFYDVHLEFEQAMIILRDLVRQHK